MIKIAVFFLFLVTVHCATVKRQAEQDIENPFIRSRYADGYQENRDREWQRRREAERRSQINQQRQRAINQQLAEWFEGDDEEVDQVRYEVVREQPRWRIREEGEYEPVYAVERSVQPYWTSYDSRAYPYRAYAMPYYY